MANIETIEVESVGKPWSPPDSTDKLYTITVKGYGEPHRTWSDQIAVLGTHQAVKTEKKGTTYWRTPKDAQSAPTQATERPKWQPKDEDAIKAMWAIGQSVSMHNTLFSTLDPEQLSALTGLINAELERSVEKTATTLFAMVDRVKNPQKDTVKDNGDFAIINEVFSDDSPVPEYQGD